MPDSFPPIGLPRAATPSEQPVNLLLHAMPEQPLGAWPAIVLRMPVCSFTSRITSLPVSVKYTLPTESIAMPYGELSAGQAPVPAPLRGREPDRRTPEQASQARHPPRNP